MGYPLCMAISYWLIKHSEFTSWFIICDFAKQQMHKYLSAFMLCGISNLWLSDCACSEDQNDLFGQIRDETIY